MSKEYFSDLNYTLSNEDTRIEFDLLKEGANNVFSIAGSGARCIPLIARNPKKINIVDMSVSQIYLVELRLSAIKSFTYEEYLFFMGFRGALTQGEDADDNRYKLFKKLVLSAECSAYWADRVAGWQPRGFIALGKWEGHFQKIGNLFRDKLQCDFSRIFEAQSLEEQKSLFAKFWPEFRWASFLRIVASEYVFNRFLYKGHFSGAKEKKTDQRAPWEMIDQEFRRIFNTQLVRKNYFMQVLFLGGIKYEEGLPLDAQRHIFEAVKASNTKVVFQVGNLLNLLPEEPWDFISLSDTISYLDSKDSSSILQKLHSETPKGSYMVIRSFLRAPTSVNHDGWIDCVELNQKARMLDGTGVYQFHIFEKSMMKN